MANYDETRAINVGRLATYDSLIKDYIKDELEPAMFGEAVDASGGADNISAPDNGYYIKDSDGNKVSPVVNEEFIVDNTGTKLSTKLAGILEECEKVSSSDNLLTNWYFVDPVNRNGKYEYSTNNSYTIDRWYLDHMTGQSGIQLTGSGIKFPSGTGFILSYPFEDHSAMLIGRTLTISCLTTVGLYTGKVTITPNSSGVVDSENIILPGGWAIDISGPRNALLFRIYTNAGTTSTGVVTIQAVKVELNEEQTLAEETSSGWVLKDIADYAEEYAKCLAYSPINGLRVQNQITGTNILDNWYFVNPINRNGFTFTGMQDTRSEVLFDRWFGSGGEFELDGENGLSVIYDSRTECNKLSIYQIIKYNYPMGIYTISALVDGELYAATFTDFSVGVEYTSEYVNGIGFSMRHNSDGTMTIGVHSINDGESRYIKAVKCELGSVQTLAYMDEGDNWLLIDPPPNYESEYVKCVQYDAATGKYIGLGAKSVNALSLDEGGTVKAPIAVETESTPAVVLKNTAAAATTIVQTSDTGAAQLVATTDESNDGVILSLNKDAQNVSDIATIKRTVNGETTEYKLFGEHNGSVEPEVIISDTVPTERGILWVDTSEDADDNYYSKNETLSDATKSALGLGENATPNDAFGVLLNRSGGSEGGDGFIETDPTVPEWAKAETKPVYVAEEVGADPAGTATSVVGSHNTNTLAHNDIRNLITDLTTRLNALADSDDITLDQLSEIVAYIKSNKSLIDTITTSKVSVSDIVNNLTTGDNKKVLSAAQGVALKALIDAIPEWAKAETKPEYTAEEVGARPSTWMPTAADVGAVAKSGDTMTGQLTAKQRVYADFPGSIKAGIEAHSSGAVDLQRLTLDGKYSAIRLYDDKGTGAQPVFCGNDTGAWYQYPLYHTGNKPTAADVGAAPDGRVSDGIFCVIPKGDKATIHFGSRYFSALISCVMWQNPVRALFYVAGYATGTNRVCVKRLDGDYRILYGLRPENAEGGGITIWNNGSDVLRVNCLVFEGDNPKVTMSDDGGATPIPYENDVPATTETALLRNGSNTMTGDLLVDKAGAAVRVHDSGQKRMGTFYVQGSGVRVANTNTETKDGVELVIGDDASTAAQALRIIYKNALQNVYHTANKPTAADVGAAPVIKYGTTAVTDGSSSSYPEGTLYVVIDG